MKNENKNINSAIGSNGTGGSGGLITNSEHETSKRKYKSDRWILVVSTLVFTTLWIIPATNLFAKEHVGNIVKCFGKQKKECLIKLSPASATSLILYSKKNSVKFRRKGRHAFTLKAGSVRSTHQVKIIRASIKWKFKKFSRDRLIRTKRDLTFKVPARTLASLSAKSISKVRGNRTQRGNSGSIGWMLYDFLSRYLKAFGFVIIIFYIIYRLQKTAVKSKEASVQFKTTIKKDMHLPSTLHPIINPDLCAACGACVTACPEGEIIKLIAHKAVLVNPTKCVGHSLCEEVCPYEAIELVFGTVEKPKQIPKIAANYETNVQGMYIAGELGGMGLIGNAVRQGTLAAADAIKSIKKITTKTDVGMLIVGAGPAGLAMGCKAATERIDYLIIEQNTFGGTVNNFPKGKVVMNRPCEFAGYGTTKFSSNKVSKESLLEAWIDIRKKMKLNIKEKTKFETLEKKQDIFLVKTSTGEITAKKVMLAMGVGGSPRKLNLENEDSGKVAYRLIDAADYQKKHVVVVGGGNSALESAQYLSDPKYRNKVTLLVRKDMSKSNQDNQDLVNQRVKSGHLKILLKASIKSIAKESIEIAVDGSKSTIQNDAIFVFAGAIMPWDFLEGLGIKIQKKTGQSEKWAYTPEEDHNRYQKKSQKMRA